MASQSTPPTGSPESSAAPDKAAKPDWAKSGAELARERRAAEGLPARRQKWPWAMLIALLAAAGGYGWYAMQQSAAPVGEPQPVPAMAVMQVNSDEMSVIARQLLERRVKVIGTLEPAHSAQLSSQAGGRVETVAVSPGDPVQAGDILVQVDVEALTLELQVARSTAQSTRSHLALGEAQLKRAVSLLERGVGTNSSLDEAQVNVASLRANLSALEDQVAVAELRLRNATLVAPIDGIVSVRTVEPGQYVSIGTPLVTVVDLSSVEMQANAAVASGSLLAAGQAVTISVDGIEDRVFNGIVTRINPVANAATRTIPVYIAIDNADGVLLGGMFAAGQIVVDRVENAIAVPGDAVRRDQRGDYVLVIADGKLVRQPVEIGSVWAEGMTLITSGLEPGQIVVTAPLPALHAGDSVEMVEN
ncbi:MAG: efflux RND transporter periplasmic adaptor subunit [Rhodoferax sp.]|nr:efflux RND transporter periplasmic adaptor subunit [Paracoccaceae bacterium]MCB2000639.1 efflux RND transporter periplasmic adaptor subunit [Rhodoferax sp.]